MSAISNGDDKKDKVTARELLTKARLDKSHWGERIIEAEDGGDARRFCLVGRRDVADAAVWTTCACGKQDPRIPRYPSGRPKDDMLCTLGTYFYGEVKFNDLVGAAKVLIEIERRAGEILRALDETEEKV